MTRLLRAGLLVLALATAAAAVGAAWEGGPWHMTGWLSPQDAAGLTTVVGLLLMLTGQLAMTPAPRKGARGNRGRVGRRTPVLRARRMLPARTRCLRPSPPDVDPGRVTTPGAAVHATNAAAAPGSTTTWRTS